MKFKDLFKDSNDINEKSVVGFCAFGLMVLFALTDLVTGYFGKDLVISEIIYNSLLILVLGSFGISGIEKIMNRKTDNSSENPEEN